jgi:drug/metabolite transporter (DMT)-like permease
MPVRPSVVSVVLFLAVLGVSLSGPLVRISNAHPIAIAVWRLLYSLLIIAVPLAATGAWRQWRSLDRRSVALAVIGGVLLALHFWSWNASVELTTIAASVVLVNTQPLIVGLLSVYWLREAPSRQQWVGIVVAVSGALVVVWPDLARGGLSLSGSAATGDAFALVGAATAATYYVIGRRLRATLDLWAYVGLVYGVCLITLVALALIIGVPLGPYPARENLIFAGLAIGPMLLGHTGMNWALKHARAYQVNIVLLGEPVGATLIAALLPGIREMPTAFTLAGGLLILTGILLAERKTSGLDAREA